MCNVLFCFYLFCANHLLSYSCHYAVMSYISFETANQDIYLVKPHKCLHPFKHFLLKHHLLLKIFCLFSSCINMRISNIMPKHLLTLCINWTAGSDCERLLPVVVQNQIYVKHVLLKLESEIPSHYNRFKYVRSETQALLR